MHTYTHAHIYIDSRTHRHIDIHTNAQLHFLRMWAILVQFSIVSMWIPLYEYIYKHTYTYIYIYIYTYIHIYTHKHVICECWNLHQYNCDIYTYIYTHICISCRICSFPDTLFAYYIHENIFYTIYRICFTQYT